MRCNRVSRESVLANVTRETPLIARSAVYSTLVALAVAGLAEKLEGADRRTPGRQRHRHHASAAALAAAQDGVQGRQLQELPEERKALIRRELLQMAPMPDEQRREHMNSEEFRNRYSITEQQMMSNLSEVTPP